MNGILQGISESELDLVWGGGNFQSRGARGGRVDFSNGNSVEVSPFATTVNLTPDGAERLSNSLNIAAAASIHWLPVAGAAAVGSSMVTKMNEGDTGVSIHVPHVMPVPVITPGK